MYYVPIRWVKEQNKRNIIARIHISYFRSAHSTPKNLTDHFEFGGGYDFSMEITIAGITLNHTGNMLRFI